MAIIVQNIQDYGNYIKCGEILKSPIKNYQNPFVLKCFECEDIHFLLESFIIHIQEHCKDVFTTTTEPISTRTRNGNKKQDELEDEIFPMDNLVIKLEDRNVADMDDPLIGVKKEDEPEKKYDSDDEFLKIPDKSKKKTADIEHHDDFEEVFFDSPDEYHPADSDSEEEIEENTNKKPRSTKKRKVSPEVLAFIENFMSAKINVTTLIEEYKNQPNLWNKDSPHYKLREKTQPMLQEISNKLNNELKLELTWEKTAKVISHIRTKHRTDYKRLKSYGKTDKLRKSVWYYEHLEFLRPKEKIQLQKLEENLPDLVPEQIIQILEMYKGFPHLWDTNIAQYVCSNKRNEAHSEILKLLELKMNLKVSKLALEAYLNNIHTYFAREKQLKTNSVGPGKPEKNSNSPNYYEHLIFLYDHEGPFSCPECKGIYSNRLQFKVHVSQHSGTIAFKCSECNIELRTVATYTCHSKRHFEPLEFKCNECDWTFFRQHELRIHMRSHSGAQPFCCEICGSSFRHSSSLKKHQRRHENIFTHTCHICSKGFITKSSYTDHINSHLGIRRFACEICCKAFITRKALKTHMVTHEEARNHACKLCGKAFKLKIGLLQHLRTHGNNVGTDDKFIPN